MHVCVPKGIWNSRILFPTFQLSLSLLNYFFSPNIYLLRPLVPLFACSSVLSLFLLLLFLLFLFFSLFQNWIFFWISCFCKIRNFLAFLRAYPQAVVSMNAYERCCFSFLECQDVRGRFSYQIRNDFHFCNQKIFS